MGGCQKCTRVHGPSTRAVNLGSGNRALQRDKGRLTGVSDVEKHCHKDVVHEIKADAVRKYRVPQHQQILHWKLAAEQQANPSSKQTSHHA